MGVCTCVLGPAKPVCYPPCGGDFTVSSDSKSATMGDVYTLRGTIQPRWLSSLMRPYHSVYDRQGHL